MQDQDTAAAAAAQAPEGIECPMPFASYFNIQAQDMLAGIPNADPGMALALATGAQASAILDVAQALRELTSVGGQIATAILRGGQAPAGMVQVVR